MGRPGDLGTGHQWPKYPGSPWEENGVSHQATSSRGRLPGPLPWAGGGLRDSWRHSEGRPFLKDPPIPPIYEPMGLKQGFAYT